MSGERHRRGMSTRSDAIDRGRRKGAAMQAAFMTEIRAARISLGKSQADAAREAGIDPAVWSRLERGERTTLTLTLIGRMAAAVGLDAVLHFYPATHVVRDEAHVRLLRDLKALLGDGWSWRHEVPLAGHVDLRAWDAVGTHRRTRLEVHVEAETSFRDSQMVMRRVEAKRIADGQPRVLLAVRASRRNREAVAAVRAELETAFPIGARAALTALREGRDPGGDALLLIDWSAQAVSVSLAR
jgi:transcriptional regulator with XRE-family HTH domain